MNATDNQPYNRVVFWRLTEIAKEIAAATAQQPVNAATLAKRFEITSKTVHRDIEFLRDFLGHQIEYRADCYTWFYTAPPPPMLRISIGRIKTGPSAAQAQVMNAILCEAARLFELTPEEIVGRGQGARHCWARHATMAYAYEFNHCSCEAVGQHFGGRDHAGVLHAIKRIKIMDTKAPPPIVAIIHRLRARLKELGLTERPSPHSAIRNPQSAFES